MSPRPVDAAPLNLPRYVAPDIDPMLSATLAAMAQDRSVPWRVRIEPNYARLFDRLLEPTATRTAARACNALLGTRIAHDSWTEWFLEIVWVAVCACAAASLAGAVFGLTQDTVDLVAQSLSLTWHITADNGLLRPNQNSFGTDVSWAGQTAF